MRRLLLLIASLACLVMVVAPLVPVVAVVNTPRIRGKDQSTSLNWSGYAVPTNAGAVTAVYGSWTVPSVTPPATGTAYSSAWVGIDGDNSNTVEQIGTDQDYYNGKLQYFAWYEMYPKYPVTVMLVKPNDSITASVVYVGRSSFTLTIKDVTTNTSFTTTQKLTSARRSSAEWIMEAPWSGGVLPLADFGTIQFSSCTAKIGNSTGTIGSFGSSAQQINMANSSGALKDQTNALTSNGSAFTVNWIASN